MNTTETVNALLTEADLLFQKVLALREAAKALQGLSGKRIPGKKADNNGVLLSSIAMPARKSKPKTGKKRKYTKRSAFWKKKK